MQSLSFAKLRFIIRPREPLALPAYKGSVFRGGFGSTFKQIVCTVRDTPCPDCLLRWKCLYPYIFETTPPPGAAVLSKNVAGIERPFVLEPPLDSRRHYTPDDVLLFHLVLIGKAIEYFPYFLYTFYELGQKGLGKQRGRYTLEAVWSISPETKTLLYRGPENRILAEPTILTPALVADSVGAEVSHLQVTFLTPGRFKHAEEITGEIEFHILFRSLLRRISSLMYFHCGESRLEEEIDFQQLIERAKTVRVVENRLYWRDLRRYSTRTQETMPYGGVMGTIRFQGELRPFLPYLRMGEYIHVGKQTTFGLGQIAISPTV